MSREITTDNEKSSPRRLLKEWYDWEKTQIKAEYEVLEDDPNIKDGAWKYYHRNGTLFGEAIYREGKLWEVLSRFDIEGNPLEPGTLSEGEGTFRGYHDNGALQMEGLYRNGLPQGTWTYYYENGSLNGGGEYNDGVKVGEWKWFRQDGTPRLRFLYDGTDAHQSIYNVEGRLSSEGPGKLIRGAFVKHGVWKEFDEEGTITNRSTYDLGSTVMAKLGDSEPLMEAYHSCAGEGVEAQVKAILGKEFSQHKQYGHRPAELLAAVTVAEAQGDLQLSPELGVELYLAMSEYVSEVLPLLELIDGDPFPLFEARLEEQLSKKHPSRSILRALFLGIERSRGDRPPINTRVETALGELLPDLTTNGERLVSYALHPLLKTIPEERLEDLVVSYSSFKKMYRARWQSVGACPTPRVIGVCIEELLTWDRSYFTYAEHLLENTKEAFAEFGAAAVPFIVEALQGDGAKCAQREILVRALGEAGTMEGAPTLLEFLNDSIDAVRQAAMDGLLALGTAGLPYLEEGLGSRKKKIRTGAAEVLAALPRTPQTEELIERCLPSVKETESVQLLEAALSAESERPEGLIALEKMWTSYTTEERDALFARMAKVEDHYHLVTNLTLLDQKTIFILGDAYLKWVREEGRDGWNDFFTEPPFLSFCWHPIGLVAGNPATPWLTAQVLVSLPSSNPWGVQTNLTSAHEKLGNKFARPLAYYLARETVDARKLHIKWLAEQAPEEGVEAFLASLSDSAKGIRDLATSALTALGESVLPKLWPMLVGPAAQVTAVATILRDVPSPDSVPYLKEALEGEKSAARQELLTGAINACQLATKDTPGHEAAESDYSELDRGLAGRKAGKVPSFETKPALRWVDGTEVSEEASKWILATLASEGPEGANVELASVRERLDDESCKALGEALVGELGWERWVSYAVGVLGDDLLMSQLGAQLQSLVHGVSAHHATHGINALVRNPTPSAIRWLDHWSRKAETEKLKKDARQALLDLMELHGLSQDDLVDQATPSFDFSIQGELEFDYAGRPMTLVLDQFSQVTVRDDKGKVAKNLPRARKEQDADALASAKERFKTIKKAVAGAVKTVLHRLEEAMIVDRRWAVERWKGFFLQHPLLYPLSRGLVFALHNDSGKITDLFYVSEDGEPTDADLKPVEFSPEAQISIPHPILLTQQQRSTWSELFADAEILQPFEQLEREFLANPAELLRTEKGTMVPARLVARSLRQFGYKAGRPEEAGNVYEATRQIGQVELVLSHGAYYIQTRSIGADEMIELHGIGAKWVKGAGGRPIPESVYSEAVRDLQAFLELGD